VGVGLVGWLLVASSLGPVIDGMVGLPIMGVGVSILDGISASWLVLVAMVVSGFPAIQLYRHAAQSGVQAV
jgi:hypothetical protein